jgi:uncharacterized membrane protein YhiD involved in acid resistance
MFDFSAIHYNSQNPGILTILFTVIYSMLLGILIAFTYDKTSREVERPTYFLQSMVLITIVAATIMQAIGDSVARGLGMLGALSIIRFRTTIRNPRNIVFMFASIAAGIACGVLGFTIAIVGTVGLCATAFLLRFSSYSEQAPLLGVLQLEIPKDYLQLDAVNDCLKRYCKKYALVRYKIFTGERKSHLLLYEYKLKLKDKKGGSDFSDALKALENVDVASLEFRKAAVENI